MQGLRLRRCLRLREQILAEGWKKQILPLRYGMTNEEGEGSCVDSAFGEGEVADFADEVDGAGDEDEAVGGGDVAGLGESGGQVGGGVGRDRKGVGGGEEVFDMRGAGVVDGGEDDVVVTTGGVGVFTRIEEGKEDAGHLFERLVAEAGEEERARLRVVQLGDGGAEGPGTGGVVGYVEQKVGAAWEMDEFETAGPVGGAMPSAIAVFVIL